MSYSKVTVGTAVTCLILGITGGVLIGYFGRQYPAQPDAESTQTPPLDVSKVLYDEVNRAKLEENLKTLTEEPHIAGSIREEKYLVDFVSERWRNSGLAVEIHPYEVLLSYPNETDSNYVAVLTGEREEILKSQQTEAILEQSQNKSNIVNPFNAYSPSGDPEGELVYVNYGRVEDFQLLKRNLSVDVKGKICIARYGKIFRADKAALAEEALCAGLILYSDPKGYTVKGKGVYPEEWYLPGTAVQRGTVFLNDGDPETPTYPSIGSAWRMSSGKLSSPRIPVTPIGYDDAVKYLEKLSGPVAPDSWQGDLNITYRLGPGFAGEHATSIMKMHVRNRNERKTIHNVIGYIKGAIEPDRYVVLGSHRDAWVFGAIDPSSAQSIMLELARVFGEAVNAGWRPRRTIVFCSWGAEEYGLVGSTEWVEEFQKNLASRAIVYVNADVAVAGGYTLYAGGVPSLANLVYDVAKEFPNPNPEEVKAGRTKLYDSWRRRWPETPGSPDTKPFFRQLGSGSDYTTFLQIPGVSVLDFGFIWDLRKGISFYPAYHTVYDTFDLVKKFVDPDFIYYQTLTRVLAEVARRLIDSIVLPISAEDYATKLIKHKDTLSKNYGAKMEQRGINMSHLTSAVDSFKQASSELHMRVSALTNKSNQLEIRAVNDQLMQLERAFIDGHGVGTKKNYKHLIYAPSKHDKYSSTTFPGLVDSMFDIDEDEDQETRWDEVRRQFSILVYHIESAASTLRDFSPMKGSSNRVQ